KSVRLYREFRKERSRSFVLANWARAIRDWALNFWDLVFRRWEPVNVKDPNVKRPSSIKFVGEWHTVDDYGLPIEELKTGIDRYLWPLRLDDPKLEGVVEKACHALSIDDRRTTFHPLLWDEEDRKRFPNRTSTDEETLTQVWFPGVHANVGGGYPDDGLSFVSLKWMIREAIKKGLIFDKEAVKPIEYAACPLGRLYNSRSGLGAYYRYDPRRLDPPRDKQNSCIPCPKIHESVIWRMAFGSDAYAPLSLPTDLRIVMDPIPASDPLKLLASIDWESQPPERNIKTFETVQAN